MSYFDEMVKAMTWLGEQDDTHFLGQAVGCPGTAMYNTLKGVPDEKRTELPVFENTQLGMSFGMSLRGTIPISIFPRWNFLLSATDQLVNHIDKVHLMLGQPPPAGVIIRTGIGSQVPMHPSFQHIGDFSDAYREMLERVLILRVHEAEDIFPEYQYAYEQAKKGNSTILVEVSDKYNE